MFYNYINPNYAILKGPGRTNGQIILRLSYTKMK